MISLRLLGPVDLRDPGGGRELGRLLGQTKRFALLAYLAGNAPRVFHRRDTLLALFWPESTSAQARHGLRQVLYELRSHLGENAILRRGAEEVALNRDVVTCDVAQLYEAIGTGELERATELYRGAFLEGFFVPGAPEAEDWIARRRGQILRDVVEACWQLVEQRKDLDDLGGAVAAARRAVEWAPTDEVGVRRLLALHHEEGNRGEAARVYDGLVHRLAHEFETEPSAETTELMGWIRDATVAHAPEPGAASPGPPASPPAAAEPPAVAALPAPAGEPAQVVPVAAWNHPVAAAALFGIASLLILGVVNVVMLEFGLPDWVLQAAVALLVVGLPIIVATALTERDRTARPDRPSLPWLNWRRSLGGGGLAFLSLGVATSGFMGLRAAGFAPAATLLTMGVLEARDPILVAEFTNRTADSTLATTLTDLLRLDLSQSSVVHMVDPATVRSALVRMEADSRAPLDEATALALAEREGLKAVLIGDVYPLGRGYVLSARLVSPTDGAMFGAERVTADDDGELIRAVDRLSAKLRERIGESLRDVRASPALERVTTGSLAALRLYTRATGPAGLAEGELAGRRLLEQAIALDTNFAMAYRGLSVILSRTGEPDAGVAALRRAFELRDRLPRVERHLVEGLYYTQVAYDGARVETAYRSVLAIDPDNTIALTNMAAHQSLSRRWAERESWALRSQAVRGTLFASLNVYYARLLQGRFDDAQAELERRSRRSNAPVTANLQSDLEAGRRDYDRAEAALWADTASVDRRRLAALLRLRGRLTEAERELRSRSGRTPGDSTLPFFVLRQRVMIEAARGSPAEAVRLLDDYAVDSRPPLGRLYLERAELYAGLGQVDRARALVADFEQRVDTAVQRRPDRLLGLRRVSGEIALSEGRFDDAIADFRTVYALSGACATCGLARLAYAWLQVGQADSALSVYERIVSTPTAGLDEDDIRLLPETYRRLGELYEARGDTVRAVDLFGRFVDLWKDADPELQPQVEEVRRRVEQLTRDGSVGVPPRGSHPD